ncbi:YaaL family protein [Clostridium sp. P21]|uniref:YaaL family protein n=1 Tax=Clostridium muellerianum TaxID=2716538 RepID=A0A7Y0EKI6_9CLOT|nr:YaaL family protein [Clostridium muellerianum]NMM64120.1 YaaL family protein [Clostridium muellerianum]
MNKKEILRYITGNAIYNKEQKRLLNEIDKAREDLKNARLYFEMVNDPVLVDYAIYMEEAAKAKYTYLLNEAKKSNLKVVSRDLFEEVKAG